MRRFLPFAVALGMLMPPLASAQRTGDIDAINRLIDRYGTLEDAMDMNGQAQLMSADRVWIAIGSSSSMATGPSLSQASSATQPQLCHRLLRLMSRRSSARCLLSLLRWCSRSVTATGRLFTHT